MEQELTAEPGDDDLLAHWSLAGIVEFYAHRLESSLPPALRHRFGAVADRLSRRINELPADAQADGHQVAAL